MRSRVTNTLSNICSGQTVLALFLSYLIILLYIIPTAYTEAIEISGLDTNAMPYLKFCRIGLLNHLGLLTDDFRSFYITTELTAGVFEDICLFAFVMALQVFIKSRSHRIEGYSPFFKLSLLAFGVDLFQTFISIHFVRTSMSDDLLIWSLFLLAIAKIAIYSFVIFTALRNWRL